MLSKLRTTLPRRQPELVSRPELPSPKNHALLLLCAPAGYGKSQLLAQWCQELSESHQLGYALCSRLGETPSTILELLFTSLKATESFPRDLPWQEQADVFLEMLFERGPTCLILDDVHHLLNETAQVEECGLLLSYLLDYRPPEVAWVFSGRALPKLAELELQILSGEATQLGPKDLALKVSHLDTLVPGHGERLSRLTSGWPIACKTLLRHQPEQWSEQTDQLGQSLLKLSTQGLSPTQQEAVALLGLLGSASRAELEQENLLAPLQELEQHGTLVQDLGNEKLAIHPLFSEHYRESAEEALRERAVAVLRKHQRGWEALELVKGGLELTELLHEYGQSLLSSGRFRLLEKLLKQTEMEPKMLLLKGRLSWFLGDPASALENFSQSATEADAAGDSRTAYEAWRASGQLYLDAVCPNLAPPYLRKAYRLLGPSSRSEKAELLDLLAENAVNLGQARKAGKYRALSRQWNQQKEEDLALTARLLLRSGRLVEARGTLQVALEREQQEPKSLEGHRDPRLVLSYVSALEGHAEQAKTLAREVLAQATELDDTRTRSAALTRLAHGHLISTGEESEALVCYSEADSLAKTLGVERLRSEPLMGMALCQIKQENFTRAREFVGQGLALAQDVGDAWLSAWLGYVDVLIAFAAKDPDRMEALEFQQHRFRMSRDRFGFALVDILKTLSREDGAKSGLSKHLQEFPFLASRSNLFGPPLELLKEQSPEKQVSAPHKLQIFCLGPLSILADGEPIPNKTFKRKKARELFVLLLGAPDVFFHREELAAQLWPAATQKAALRDFRVALHALSDALEPQRPKNTTAFCIERQEERYRLLSEKIDMDSSRFEALLAEAPSDSSKLERAVRLYRGRFCEDYPYLESLDPIRQRYDELYLQAAQDLAQHYLRTEQAAAATELAQKMLQRDATWEPAYRILLRSQHALGHEHLLPRTFTRCLETLEQELGVEPSEETFSVARELLGDQLATIL